MSDTRVQNYFLTGKYPDIEEVQKVYGTLTLFGDQEGGVSLTDLRKISQLPLTKLKVILALLKKSGYVGRTVDGRYMQPASKGGPRVLDLANYETKKAYDQSRLAMMLQYAESASCRRKFILNYFGEEYERALCGACDNCLRELRRQSAATLLPGAVTAASNSGFRIGDLILHAKFGQGTVERTEKDLVTVLFPSVGYKTLLASAVRRAAPEPVAEKIA